MKTPEQQSEDKVKMFYCDKCQYFYRVEGKCECVPVAETPEQQKVELRACPFCHDVISDKPILNIPDVSYMDSGLSVKDYLDRRFPRDGTRFRAITRNMFLQGHAFALMKQAKAISAAELVEKAREWCEQLSSEPSFDYLEGEHRITNGEYERANDLLAFLEAEVGK